MIDRFVRRAHALAAIAVVSMAASGAVAQSAAEKAAARDLAVEGIKLADAGNCKDAIPKLEKAEKLFHAPTILGRLGECHVQLGRVVLGTELLLQVIRESLAPDAPAAFVEAQDRAKRVRDKALARIGKLRIVITPENVDGLQVTVDGQPMSTAFVGTDRPTDPGRHRIEASAPGHRATTADVTLADGQIQIVKLDLVADASAPAPTPPVATPAAPATEPAAPPSVPPAQPPAEPTADPGGGGSSPVLGIVLLGVGAVGVGVGAFTGLTASSKKSDLDEVCVNDKCPSTVEDDLDSAKQMALISTIGFGAGAVAIAAGVIVLVTGGSSSDEATPPVARGFRAEPVIGFGSAGVRGTF